VTEIYHDPHFIEVRPAPPKTAEPPLKDRAPFAKLIR
jgi:hypothetical protein